MDLKYSCWHALAILAVQAASVSASEPALIPPRETMSTEWQFVHDTRVNGPYQTALVLNEEDSGFVDFNTRQSRRVVLLQDDSTDGDSLSPLEVSKEEICVDDSTPFDDSCESDCGWVRGRFDDWLSSMECREPYWFTGVEFSFLDIDAQTGGQITLSQTDTTAPGIASVSFRDGNGLNDKGYAPRLWVGHRFGEKWAVQARYWDLNRNLSHAPDQLVPSTGTNFATYTEVDRMEASTMDVEAVRSFQPGDWKIDAFVGGRHATFGAESQIHAFGVFTTGNFTNLFLSNGCSYEGTGVTYGLAVRRPIGETNFHVYASARGSTLAGHSDNFGRSAGAIASSPSPPLVGAATVTRNNAKTDLYIAEFQLGVEWNHALTSVPAIFFVRTGYEYQDWNLVGPPTGGAGFGGTIGELTTDSFSSANLGDMQLHGLTFATGLTW